jgi:hypothetical protein
VGSAGIAPLSVTVRAPHTFANFRASLSRPSSCLSHKGKTGVAVRPYNIVSHRAPDTEEQGSMKHKVVS